MMSLSYIRSLSAQAARESAKAKKEPVALFSEDTALDDIRRSPFIGDRCPKGWKPAQLEDYVDSLGSLSGAAYPGYGKAEGFWLFVDTSGFGSDTEPALSVRQLERAAKALVRAAADRGVTVGTALVEVGQFQGHIGVFERREKKGVANHS